MTLPSTINVARSRVALGIGSIELSKKRDKEGLLHFIISMVSVGCFINNATKNKRFIGF